MSTDSDLPTSAPPGAATGGGCEILVQNPCRYPEAGVRRHRRWLGAVVAELAPEASTLVVRFTSDRAMRQLNRRYRGRDQPTDVLSFPGCLPPESGLRRSHLGDVVVSVPTARRQAAELGHEVERELRILMLHGILHCLGHDHERDGDAMDRLEKRLRRRWIDDE